MSANGGGLQMATYLLLLKGFWSFEEFKAKFSKLEQQFVLMERLCVHKGGKLDVCGTPNQDNPLMPGVGCGGTQF
jgi:Fe-Mn family superoxide dismutase